MTQPFENFHVHEGNRFAYAAAMAVCEQPFGAYNPLFLWGDAGSGKSHLLNAMAAYTKSLHLYARIKRVSHANMTFLVTAPQADLILLDDAQESSMRKLIDLVDLTKNQVVIASREKPPSDLTEPFGYGLVVQMGRARDVTKQDWRSPNGKFLEECSPNDIRTLDDRSLIKLQRFLHDERAAHRKDWLEPDRRWMHLGLLEFVTRLGTQERGLELGKYDRLRFPR